MRIVSKTDGVVVCTLSLHADRALVQILAGGAYRFGPGARFDISWCILILNKGEITHLVVDMDLE